MTGWLTRSLPGLIILVLAALPFALNGLGSDVARATHTISPPAGGSPLAHIDQISIDLGPAGTNVGVNDNGFNAAGDRDGDGVVDAEGAPDGSGSMAGSGTCGNGLDDDGPDSTSGNPDGVADDGCQVTLTELDTCREIINDDILNADEDFVDTLVVDVTVGVHPGTGPGTPGGVPPDNGTNGGMSAWQYALDWTPEILRVNAPQLVNFLINSDGAGSPFTNASQPLPQFATPFTAAISSAGPVDDGSGVVSRLRIEGDTPGIANLSFSNNAFQDRNNATFTIDVLNTAQIAVSDAVQTFPCPGAADIDVTNITTGNATPGGPVGVPFDVIGGASVHNLGPDGPANTDVSFSLALPSDCSTTSPNPAVVQDLPLAVSVAQTTPDQTWSVTCTNPSDHSFVVTVTATEDDPGVSDPVASNNSDSANLGTGSVTGTADPAVSAVTVTGAVGAVVGTPFNVDVGITLDNSGNSPASADVTGTLTLPAGCTTSTANPQMISGVTIPVSPPSTTATATFSVTCTTSGAKDFSAAATLTPVAVVHVTGDDPANNGPVNGNATITVSDAADLKVTSVTVTAPANTSVGAAFDVTADVVVHNNGPTASANADVTNTLVLPPDCSPAITSANPAVDSAVPLAVSTASTLPHTWSVTCTQPSNHDFTVNSGIALSAGQPNVVDPNTANDTGTGSGTSATVTSADLKVASVTLTAPASANPNTAFSVSVDASLHNNGPFGPVNSNATIELTVPAGCTATPAGAQTAANISLPVSTATTMPKQTFSVTCTTSGAKAFSAKVTASLNIVHVSDPTAGNATATSATHTVNVGAAGLPPTGGDSGTLPGDGLTLLLLLPLGAIIAGAGLLTLRRNRRSMRF